jgi:hypothetical protein
MSSWDSLIRFQASEDSKIYWAALDLDTIPVPGLSLYGFDSVEALETNETPKRVTVKKVG